MELKHKYLVFFKLIECIKKKKICHGVKQYAKYVPLCNNLKSLSYEDKELIRRERRDGVEGEGRGLRNRDIEKRDKRELS